MFRIPHVLFQAARSFVVVKCTIEDDLGGDMRVDAGHAEEVQVGA